MAKNTDRQKHSCSNIISLKSLHFQLVTKSLKKSKKWYTVVGETLKILDEKELNHGQVISKFGQL